MFKRPNRKSALLLSLLLSLALIWGCAAPGRYILKNPPTQKTKAFKNVEVLKVEIGITKDELEPELPLELRTAIIEEIQNKRIYENIATELNTEQSTLQIQPKIIEFDKGSQALRWLVGSLGGKAHLDVECKFINKETGDLVAEGTFIGEITGGFFGGAANQKTMSKYVASHIARFLKKGK